RNNESIGGPMVLLQPAHDPVGANPHEYSASTAFRPGFRRDLRSMLSRFGQSNGDSLFSTLHLSSRSSAFQLAMLEFVHRSLYIFLRLAAIFASHDSSSFLSDVPSQ